MIYLIIGFALGFVAGWVVAARGEKAVRRRHIEFLRQRLRDHGKEY